MSGGKGEKTGLLTSAITDCKWESNIQKDQWRHADPECLRIIFHGYNQISILGLTAMPEEINFWETQITDFL